jgi:alpha-amylase/alpha-mannosidase (GH57 family)
MSMKDAFVAIHGHFYQPPRESPWLGVLEREESAHPFHDWNERIASECYRPNAHARIVDGQGKILNIINNYSHISFNFGPTLFRWLETRCPLAYQRILEADRESLKRLGHGNAIAQVYDHLIMPLANDKDRETEVLWGISDFEKRFQRRPESMWLPEAAVDYPTLKVLVQQGMKFLILSPFQALRVRPLGGTKWTDVSNGQVDPSQPYRCFVRDGSGRKIPDRFIDIFFYDGAISREVSFGDLLKDGNLFSDQLVKAYQPGKKRPQLIHISTDGETYGHHKKFGDMALAYALTEGLSSRGMEIINYGAFLKRFPSLHEVEIDEGPKGEGSSWSCSHGVGRWKEDCGCSTGAQAGWNQRWRKPLREALDSLRNELNQIFEREGESVFEDPRAARNGYIRVILDRSSENLRAFYEEFGRAGLSESGRIKGLRLLEMERHALQMFTSCGWFFADLAGLETILILQHASRAIQLAADFSAEGTEGRLLQKLSLGKSNLPDMGRGDQIYERFVRPKWVTPEKVVNHFAISSLFEDKEEEKEIFSFRVGKINYEKMEEGDRFVVLGQVRVTPEIIPEAGEYFFGLIPSKDDIFRTWVVESKKGLRFETLKAKSAEGLGKDETELIQILGSILGNHTYTIRDSFREGRQSLLQRLIQKDVDEHRRIYGELFDKSRPSIETLAAAGLEIPYEIRVAAEVTLNDRLFREVEGLSKEFKVIVEQGRIDRIIEEAEQFGYRLRRDESSMILNQMLNQKMDTLQKGMKKESPETMEAEAKRVDELVTLVDQAKKWGFELRKGEAQNIMHDMLDRYFGELELSWWGWGPKTERPLPSSLILLAEKLDFNVERFAKIKTGR